jgi:hypothetical protein
MPFLTQRERLLAAYADQGDAYVLSTQPYHSTKSFLWQVVNADTTNGVAFAVCRENQVNDFFDYGVGNRINLSGNANHQASEAETNLGRGKSTNGASDFVIEGIGMTCRAAKVAYAGGSEGFADYPAAPDADVQLALLGQAALCDPAAIVAPPQVLSPYNLENALFQALLPFLSLVLKFDRNTIKPLGLCSLLPEAGANSYLRTNGQPTAENVFAIDEGYIWRRDGQGDSEFVARVRSEAPVVCPITLITPPGEETPVAPAYIYTEIQMRVYGIEVEAPSQN